MDKFKYDVHHEAKDHFVVKHPDGSHFKVAKASLSPEMMKHMQKMCMGGEAGYSDGGPVIDPKTNADFQKGFNPSGQPAPTPTPTPQPQMFADGGEVESEEAVPVTEAPVPTTPETEKQVVQESAQVPLSNDLQAQYEANNLAQQGAVQDIANAQGDEATKQADVLAQSIGDENNPASLKGLQDRILKTQADKDKFAADTVRALQNQDIDPDHYVKSLGVGGKIATAASILLGQVASPLTGGNWGLQAFNSEVKKDIDRQKYEGEKAQNLYNFFRDKSSSDREAENDTHNLISEITQQQLMKTALTSKDPQVQAQAQIQIANLKNEALARKQQNAVLQLHSAISGGEVPKQLLSYFPDKQKTAIILPNGQTSIQAVSPEAAKEANDTVAITSRINSALDRLKQLRTVGSKLPLNAQRAQAKSILTSLDLNELKASGGRISPKLIDLVQQLHSDPTSILDAVTGDARDQALRKTTQDNLDSILAKASIGYHSPNKVPGARKRQSKE